METWEIDFEWLKVRHIVKKSFAKKELPDLQTILFLIGVQELGSLRTEFSKEEKSRSNAYCSLFFTFKKRGV